MPKRRRIRQFFSTTSKVFKIKVYLKNHKKRIGIFRQTKKGLKLIGSDKVTSFKKILDRENISEGLLKPACFKVADRILKIRKNSIILRIRIRGKYSGKKTSLTSHTRFSRSSKEYKIRSIPAQLREFVAYLLLASILRKLKHMKRAASETGLRPKDHKKFGRFFVNTLSVHAIL